MNESVAADFILAGVVTLALAIALVGAAVGVVRLWECVPGPRRRARELMFAKLDAAQRRSWQRLRRFDVVAPSGTRYTLSSYRPFNIRTSDAAYCLRVYGNIPAYDKLLAQKLLIEADEQYFLACANRA